MGSFNENFEDMTIGELRKLTAKYKEIERFMEEDDEK